jgi:hypothetical protein
MASLVLAGDTSGSITVSAPAVAGSTTQTLVNVTGTLAPIVSGTAVTASGTSVDFTGIPSWAKRVTVMFSGVSTNGTSNIQVQLGSGSFSTSGYNSQAVQTAGVTSSAVSTTGLLLTGAVNASALYVGICTIANISGNSWIASGTLASNISGNINYFGGPSPTLSGTLDRLRITTVNGTDTFDAGTINILYE